MGQFSFARAGRSYNPRAMHLAATDLAVRLQSQGRLALKAVSRPFRPSRGVSALPSAR
jgi:hypothetical protein